MCKERAFTLLELIITIAIAAILITAAVPAWTRAVTSNQLTTELNRLRANLEMARNHAITARTRIVVCKAASNDIGCDSNSDWTNGWWVFEDKLGNNQCVDTDNDGRCDNTGGRILVKGSSIARGFYLSATGNPAWRVVYDQTGATPGYMGTFSLCSIAMSDYRGGLRLMATGRVRIAPTSALSCNK